MAAGILCAVQIYYRKIEREVLFMDFDPKLLKLIEQGIYAMLLDKKLITFDQYEKLMQM